MSRAERIFACAALFTLILLPCLQALSEGDVPLAPRPQWVTPVGLDGTSGIDPSLIDYGYYYILNDQQLLASPQEHYRHFAFRVISHSGLEEASRIEISWQPSYETLALHGFRVWRDGKAVDYRKRIRWRELQQEAALNEGLYDESRTMLLILEDIRKDDVVEYDYTIRGRNPIFGSTFSGILQHGLEYPMATLSLRLLIPRGRKITVRQHVRALPEAERTLADGTREIVWAERDSPAIQENADTPAWYNDHPWIEMSEWRDWAQVKAWGVSVFIDAASGDRKARLKTDETLKKAYHQILAQYIESAPLQADDKTASVDDDGDGDIKQTDILSREERLLAVLRFVQDEIRYFGIEVGANSHRPRNPADVLDGRFGDCKDKALLFCRMARLAGWDAWPVLVNSSLGRKLDEWLPSPGAFDHVIVAVRSQDGLLWFDPTISYQGGPIDDVWVPDYGKTVMLDPASAALTAMPAEKAGDIDVHETYASSDFAEPGTLEVVSVFRGHEADRMRYQMASTGRVNLEKSYLDFYQAAFPNAEKTADITSHDDRAENALEIREAYSVPGMWRTMEADAERGRELFLYPYTFSKHFSEYDDIGMNRTAPLGLVYPWRARHRITVRLPESLNIENDEYKSDNPWYRLEYRAKRDGLTVELDYQYEPLVETVLAADFPAFRGKLESDRKGYLGYTLSEETDAAGSDGETGEGKPAQTVAMILSLLVTGVIAYRFGLLRGRERP